ncbi:MAG: hypothetical protein LBI68_02385, partial [Azoarcus sp.]|nr:hypothetical protein [Azoarcus sp.]
PQIRDAAALFRTEQGIQFLTGGHKRTEDGVDRAQDVLVQTVQRFYTQAGEAKAGIVERYWLVRGGGLGSGRLPAPIFIRAVPIPAFVGGERAV